MTQVLTVIRFLSAEPRSFNDIAGILEVWICAIQAQFWSPLMYVEYATNVKLSLIAVFFHMAFSSRCEKYWAIPLSTLTS